MMHSMILRIAALATCLTLAASAVAETVYKYRRADGQVMYSNRPVAGLELIETFEYSFAEPAPANRDAAKSAVDAEARITKHLVSLQAAWSEVQEAGKALAAAEDRLRAGVEPEEGEPRALAGPAKPAPPSAGGPQAPAAPSAGGPSKAAPSAVGGPLGTRRGGGLQPEYRERSAALQAEVQAARERWEAALRRYNELR